LLLLIGASVWLARRDPAGGVQVAVPPPVAAPAQAPEAAQPALPEVTPPKTAAELPAQVPAEVPSTPSLAELPNAEPAVVEAAPAEPSAAEPEPAAVTDTQRSSRRHREPRRAQDPVTPQRIPGERTKGLSSDDF
jgi:hypothetical protein